MAAKLEPEILFDITQWVTIKELAEILEVTTQTLVNWYAWYYDDDFAKPADCPVLPMYYTNGDVKITRFWKKTDIEKLKVFKKYLKEHRGIMAAFTIKFSLANPFYKQKRLLAEQQKKEE